jgi:hypothetical protein
LTQSAERASLNNTLAPMLANRTSFATVLTDIGSRHRKFSETLDEGNAGESSLALKFPTFVCEVKLDGERMVTHIHRGVVTMQVCPLHCLHHLICSLIEVSMSYFITVVSNHFCSLLHPDSKCDVVQVSSFVTLILALIESSHDFHLSPFVFSNTLLCIQSPI